MSDNDKEIKDKETRNAASRLGMPLAAGTLLAIMTWGCASMGTPSGGPRDEDPPRFIRANPPMGATDVSINLGKASLWFDEYINVKDAFSKVMISPTSASTPRVTGSGHRVNIEFQDTLLPNTTYTVDFADAITDNNEGNALSGFFYTFSTGAVLDSLEISGMVLGALDLEPQQQVLVGVYPAEAPDSAFFSYPFERIALTDEKGRFTIPGLRPVPYRIYALKDQDADRKYANPEEDLAIYPFTITPSSERIEVSDTILNLKTGAVDTIVSRLRTRFLPNDILLRMFNTGVRPQYLAKYERQDSTRLTFQFNAPADSLPVLEFPAYPDLAGQLITEHSLTNDTITFWLPRWAASVDSLEVAASFLRPDSTGNLVPGIDMLDFNFKRPAPPKVKKKKKTAEADTVSAPPIIPKPPVLSVSVSASGTQDVNRPLFVEFQVPLASLDTAAFRLEQKKDTLWIPVANSPVLERADTLNPRRFRIDYPWDYKTTYRLVADSAAAIGLYGQVSDRIQSEFTTKDEEDYSTLMLDIKGLLPSDHAFVELLTPSDTPLRRETVVNGKVDFRFLNPGTYYLRLVEDFNGDGKYTPGDPYAPDGGMIPDQAFYFPQKIVLKKNWDVDQTWNLFETPVDLQKPMAIMKNKPKPKKGETQNYQDEGDEEEYFDPSANPFDPKDVKRRQEQARQRANGGVY